LRHFVHITKLNSGSIIGKTRKNHEKHDKMAFRRDFYVIEKGEKLDKG
jgi:hypothetical protein